MNRNIPDGWKAYKLSEIGEFYSGLTGKSKKDFENGNAKFITFVNVLYNLKIDLNMLSPVQINYNEKQNTVKKGDLFFTSSSETPEEVGMCAILMDDVENTYLNSFCFGFRLTSKVVNPLYLCYMFNSDIGRNIIFKLAQGSTRYNLSKTAFIKSDIIVPPIEEQCHIADILSTQETKTKLIEKQLELEKQKEKALMQLLLSGKVRWKK